MSKFRFAIDRGGTFTDIWALGLSGKVYVLKLLSDDPENYEDAPREGIRRIIEMDTGIVQPRHALVDGTFIDSVRMGTTVATNALLERKGHPTALVITSGFKDVLYIGNQSRPNIFDLKIEMPELIYDTVVEVDERVILHQEGCCLGLKKPCFTVDSGEKVIVLKELNETKLRADLLRIKERGIDSLAVLLLHAHIYPEHERRVGALAAELGFGQISLSHAVMPMIRAVPRGYTTTADAYLTPCIRRYVRGFAAGFRNGLQDFRVTFMKSDSGLTPVDEFMGSRAILSGPAGGVVGFARTCAEYAERGIIGFDMGGTSTDVSRYDGAYEHVFESTTAGITIQAPQLSITTVAAGGGSRLFYRNGMFEVGPESAGANPGPRCYRKGGHLTITDANVVLGRVIPEFFPSIFGEHEDQPLDLEASKAAMSDLTSEVNMRAGPDRPPISVEEVALGFVRVANAAMCRPIRAITQGKGHDTARHTLACFGGAGGQHACAMARDLGIGTVFVHKYSGILSAYGLAMADLVYEEQKPCHVQFTDDNFTIVRQQLHQLRSVCAKKLSDQGFTDDRVKFEEYLNLRYRGTDFAMMCTTGVLGANDGTVADLRAYESVFVQKYQQEFGFTLRQRDMFVDDVRVRGIGVSEVSPEPIIAVAARPPTVVKTVSCYFDGGYRDTNIYSLDDLHIGHNISGPAIIIDRNSTILVEPECTAEMSKSGNVVITVHGSRDSSVGTTLDPIHLSIFSHRFMSIAEQMGRILQRTAISTNIKERLDFSCALFGADGGLVANAPHIPVHLGAMQEAVQYQMRARAALGGFRPGQVLLSNHPEAGGSHLPDLTVITPVFYKGSAEPVFFVANRGHHADIGGKTPGSMPPHSKTIFEEGAVFKSFLLVEDGVFREEAVTEELMKPKQYPGCSGTRNLTDNISDLHAQVAANNKGITLVEGLIDEYGYDVVQAYMTHIQDNAESAVREMLREIGQRALSETGETVLRAKDYMDDGSCINLEVRIDAEKGSAVFDFGGTDCEVYGNLNAPTAVARSCLIYCLRCLVARDVPLNQGCLRCTEVRIPAGSLLRPSDVAAVVGGNVLTSQRVVDVIFRAFQACAASQGCMNNVTFGDASKAYYETIAGGAGAGPTYHGRSGVHTHMTNTRITDPEVLEQRYPVILREFSLNPASGGEGRYRGGCGVVRELLFRRANCLSVLSERRVLAPYGLQGGKDGRRGRNLVKFADGRTVSVGGKVEIDLSAGDIFRVETPGGGGWGDKTPCE